MSLHALLGQIISRISEPVMRRLLQDSRRARVVLLNDGAVLLVRSVLGSQEWSLPGGGIHSNEEPAAGAAREVKEELGLALAPTQLQLLYEREVQHPGYTYQAFFFKADLTSRDCRPHRWEILEARWWPLAGLPVTLHPYAQEALSSLETTKKPTGSLRPVAEG